MADKYEGLAEELKKKGEQTNRKQIAKGKIKLTAQDLGYKFELFKINRTNLSKFVFLDNRRKTCNSQIASLKKLLFNGGHFDSPLVINEIDGMYRIIDGNHRIETITFIINKYPRYSIEVLLIKYKNLDEDGEVKTFRMWNVGRQQSLDDFIQSVAKKIPILRWIKKDFPVEVTIYRTPKTLAVKNLFTGYMAAKKFDDQGISLNRENFTNGLMELTEEDYKYLVDFFKNFKNVFGKIEQKNRYYKNSFLYAVQYIMYEQKDDKIWNKLRDKVLGNQEVIELTLFTNREAVRKMIILLNDLMRLKGKLRV